jgi:hypothetical protein
LNSSLKSFIDENCSHLLKPLEGHTGIPVQYANTNRLINMSDVVSLNDRYSPELFKDLKGSVGVYVFFKEGEEVVTQCGSSINLSNRMYNHYRRAIKGEFIFENHPVSDYKWIPVAYNKDYVELYSSMYSMSVEEEQILTFFTQQEIRSVEQAYSTYAKPTNYKGIPINTWHNNWHPDIVTNQSKNVTWITKDGHSYNRSSITAAARELGLSHQYIRDVAKVEGKTLMTVKYGEVVVTVDSIIKGSKLDLRGNTPLNNFVDQNELQPGYYYLYDSDMNQLPHGPYATARELNTAMGKDTKPNTLSRWVNYLHLVETVSLGLSVYIVKRFTDFKVPVIAHCLTNNTVLELDSLNNAAKLVGATNSSALLTFMLKEKPYKASNGNMYVLKYKDKADYDKALMQLEKRLEATRKWKAAKKS